MGVIYKANSKIKFPTYVLWNLYGWATLHLAGGNLSYQGTRFYDIIILPLVGEPYNILKYDQLVHIYGFFVATLTIYYVLKPLLKSNHGSRVALSVVVVMAGLGLGALNEIVEFAATVIMPNTGVGSYINNALDLVTDFIGAIIAFIYLQYKEC
jgi:putative membrane protein